MPDASTSSAGACGRCSTTAPSAHRMPCARRGRPIRRHACQYSTLGKPVDHDPSTSRSGPPEEGQRSSTRHHPPPSRAVLERMYRASSAWWATPAASNLLPDPAANKPQQQGLYLVSVEDKQESQPAAPPRAEPPPPNNDDDASSNTKSPDYYANVGDAIRALREDIPHLFDRELNYSLYRDDIVFRDPRNTFEGISNYKLIFWSLRFHGRLFFSKLYVEVKRIWQPEDGLIRMRWTVHGVPRVPWEAHGVFDGVSQYKLDRHGRIFEHAVDNVILRDPPMQGLGPLLAGLNLVPAPQQQPCPGAWFSDHPQQQAAAAAASSRCSSGGGGGSGSSSAVGGSGSGCSSGGGGGDGSSSAWPGCCAGHDVPVPLLVTLVMSRDHHQLYRGLPEQQLVPSGTD